MKTLAIIGSNGMVGSDLIQYLGAKFQVTPINRDNYQNHIGDYFDIVINANGNSKRFWANQNPLDDFFVSTVSVYKSIFDFPCEMYIYISSPDVYENHTGTEQTKESNKIVPENLSPYGLHKYLAELIVKKYKEKFLILRHSMILGSNLRKGPFYDIMHNNPLFITLSSKLQLITTSAVAYIIKTLLENTVVNETINIGGKGTLAFGKIREYYDRKIKISPQAETQIYEMNVEKITHLYPTLKTSEEYLQEFLKGL